jgi:hypothetical protein
MDAKESGGFLRFLTEFFEAKLQNFLDVFHQFVEVFALGETPADSRHRANEIAVLALLNDDRVFAFHRSILPSGYGRDAQETAATA